MEWLSSCFVLVLFFVLVSSPRFVCNFASGFKQCEMASWRVSLRRRFSAALVHPCQIILRYHFCIFLVYGATLKEKLIPVPKCACAVRFLLLLCSHTHSLLSPSSSFVSSEFLPHFYNHCCCCCTAFFSDCSSWAQSLMGGHFPINIIIFLIETTRKDGKWFFSGYFGDLMLVKSHPMKRNWF